MFPETVWILALLRIGQVGALRNIRRGRKRTAHTNPIQPLLLPFEMSIQLHFGNWMRVGGEMLNGEVELKFPQIIEDGVEEVHVKLRGRVQA